MPPANTFFLRVCVWCEWYSTKRTQNAAELKKFRLVHLLCVSFTTFIGHFELFFVLPSSSSSSTMSVWTVLLFPQLIWCHYSRWSRRHVPCFILLSNTSSVDIEWTKLNGMATRTHINTRTIHTVLMAYEFKVSDVVSHALWYLYKKKRFFLHSLKNELVFLRSLLNVLCLNVLQSHRYFSFSVPVISCVPQRQRAGSIACWMIQWKVYLFFVFIFT